MGPGLSPDPCRGFVANRQPQTRYHCWLSQAQKCAFGWSLSVVRVESATFDSSQSGLPRLK